MELRGSGTEVSLMKAFAGESQARNRYTYYASAARREGFEVVARVFEETASQEKEHAKRFFSFMQGGEVTIEAAFPAGPEGGTLENLRAAAAGEEHEHTVLYPAFADLARKEGFDAIAGVFEAVRVAEVFHGRRFARLADAIENRTIFGGGSPASWRCLNCGYVHEGPEAPASCPACAHPRAFFERL